MKKSVGYKHEKVFPSWIWAVYLGLFAFSIPWYLPANLEMELVFGLPAWLISCISFIVITAIFTAWVIQRFW